jgi:hypothetical protein
MARAKLAKVSVEKLKKEIGRRRRALAIFTARRGTSSFQIDELEALGAVRTAVSCGEKAGGRIVILIAALLAAGTAFASDSHVAEAVRPLLLEKAGEERMLPERILGASAEATTEHLMSDPAKVAAIKSVAPALVRFPGGSQSNFYNWRIGQIEVEVSPENSKYMHFWANAAANIRRGIPEGTSIEEYADFGKRIGAEIVLVPNLETSTVADQVAWFRRMKEEGIVPRYIELGNEFWIAMGYDPDSLKRWPDEPSSMEIMKRYADALRPFLPPGAKLAVQASGAEFHNLPAHPIGWRNKRLRQWDNDLKPAPWFDAVTIHLYPRTNQLMGETDASAGFKDPAQSIRLFHALMAHADEGTDRALDDVIRRVPGKEIWVTEWNTRGGDYEQLEQPAPGMMAQLVARTIFAYLRHPEVTMSLFFTLNFHHRITRNVFAGSDSGGFELTPLTVALKWLDEAANGGANYQRFVEPGARVIPGGGKVNEGYRAVEAGLFRAPGVTTLIIQNCSPEPRSFAIPESFSGQPPSEIQTLSTPRLASDEWSDPIRRPIEPGAAVQIPPWSLTRVLWTKHALNE